MPTNLYNNTNSVEIDINPNLKYTISKGGYDVLYNDTGDGLPYVYIIFRSNTLTENTIKLDYRDCYIMPDETGFTSATKLRDKLLEWNISKTSINDSALPSGASTSVKQDELLAELQLKADVTENHPVALKGYRSSDETYQPIRLDRATNTIQTIEYEHHKIHAGSHFFYTDSVELNSSGVQDYMLTTPNTTKWIHLIFSATGSAITQVQVYEAGDRNGTTAQTIYNSDRNSSTASALTIHKGQSGGSTDGTLIWQMKSGSATAQSRAGLTTNRSSELILKQNTKYIIRITSGTNANLTNLQLEWYEHTNIN